MANSSDYQLLAFNVAFRNKVRMMLLKVAHAVKEELDSTPYHVEREVYANRIIQDADNQVNKAAQNLVIRQGIYQNMHECTTETLAADQAAHDPNPEVGDLVYDGTKVASTWFDEIDQTVEEQIEAIYNYLARIDLVVEA